MSPVVRDYIAYRPVRWDDWPYPPDVAGTLAEAFANPTFDALAALADVTRPHRPDVADSMRLGIDLYHAYGSAANTNDLAMFSPARTASRFAAGFRAARPNHSPRRFLTAVCRGAAAAGLAVWPARYVARDNGGSYLEVGFPSLADMEPHFIDLLRFYCRVVGRCRPRLHKLHAHDPQPLMWFWPAEPYDSIPF